MENPFLYNGALGSNASINKVVLKKLPVKGIEDDIVGKSAHDVFSTRLIVEAVKECAEDLKLNITELEEKMLPIYLSECLGSEEPTVKLTAERIVELFGKRLGLILLTLKKGEQENRTARGDWGASHWEYWANLNIVILVGGLASGRLGKGIKYWVEKLFYLAEEKPYEIILVENSAYAAIAGCSTYIESYNSINLIFDLGQSFIKRSVVRKVNGGLEKVEYLKKKPSLNMDWIYDDDFAVREQAVELDNYLIKVICDTYKEVGSPDIGEEIVISIANYVNKGILLEGRGGYAKLCFVAHNYGEYLSNKLSQELKRLIKVILVHDGTAMAAAFTQYNNSVCVSLGTAFGVGFPGQL